MTTLPAALYDPAAERTHTELVDPQCRAAKTHWLTWAGVGLCCLTDTQLGRLTDPRTTVDQLERHRI